MNQLGEQYVRAAQRFGDAQTVYETAERDRLLSASELGWVAARLRRLDPTREANHWRDDHGRRHSWPKFQLTERQRDRLGRRLLEGGIDDAKTVATYLGASRRWVAGRLDYWRAVSEWVRQAGPGHGIDLLDAASVDSSLYGVLTTILGHGSDSGSRTRDRLSTSGVGGDIVTAGLRFGRLEVVRLERDGSNRKVAACRCDCGNETAAKPSHLLRGEKRSCGCLRRERMAAMKRETVS
jgi:hypothetical protein